MKQFTVLLILHLSISLFGQDSLALCPKKNSIQLELLGNGALFSINYERILLKENRFQICGRMGLTYNPRVDPGDYPDLGLITELDFLIGKKKTFFEIGSGLTYFYELHNYHDKILNETRGALFYIPRIGFRYKFGNDKIFINFIRVGFTPVVQLPLDYGPVIPQYLPYGGIAIGHSF